jgi:citrate lyase subunit beta/citryl-CoA lyase
MDGSLRRSWLMVPSGDVAQVEQAATSAADVVVLDLMECVPEAMKPAAREGLPEAIRSVSQGGAEVFAQVDKELLYADLAAGVWAWAPWHCHVTSGNTSGGRGGR